MFSYSFWVSLRSCFNVSDEKRMDNFFFIFQFSIRDFFLHVLSKLKHFCRLGLWKIENIEKEFMDHLRFTTYCSKLDNFFLSVVFSLTLSPFPEISSYRCIFLHHKKSLDIRSSSLASLLSSSFPPIPEWEGTQIEESLLFLPTSWSLLRQCFILTRDHINAIVLYFIKV